MNLFQRLVDEIKRYEENWSDDFYRRYDIARSFRDAKTGIFRFGMPHKQTGRFPMSITLNRYQRLFRWHESKYLFEGEQIYRMFLDGSWKLNSESRFAGRGLNCGHYFGLTEHAVTAERMHYDMSANDLLISFDAQLTDILDLTHADTIANVFRRLVDLGRITDEGFLSLPWEMVYELMENTTGGTWITDYVGHWAAESGYAGILFFSARSAETYRTHCFENRNRNLGGLDFREQLYTMRLDKTSYCLVIFSGAVLLPLIRSITVTSMDSTSRTIENPYFGWPVEQVRALSHDFGDVIGRVHYVGSSMKSPN